MTSRRPSKRPLIECLDVDDTAQEVYRFQILLPNGTTTRIILRDPGDKILLDEFILAIRKEVEKSKKSVKETKRKVLWNEDIYLEDMSGNMIKKKIHFSHFKSNKWHMLRLHDGDGDSVDTFQNMWDLTPDTDLLAELPAEYTFETALADLIDNSLQAVWSNGPEERKLISITVDRNEILIFDSGPGMDGSDENCIVKWGKMGSSNHRASRELGIGGKPPYLMPFFGMYGYGGAIASMHLGRQVIVSSKTKESRKVYFLHLARDALLNKSSSESSDYIWRTDGGIRYPQAEEIQVSPHGSFTKYRDLGGLVYSGFEFVPKGFRMLALLPLSLLVYLFSKEGYLVPWDCQVHILGAKDWSSRTFRLQCLLKDIYFPYIQCDEEGCARKTTRPIEFQVNGTDLAEVDGGEVAVTNLLSCNGPDFIFQLRFSINQLSNSSKSSGSNYSRKANARLRCVYFPVIKGKESIDSILEKLQTEGCGITEDFESSCRVSIRRNGRLLPDARWGRLSFMEPKLKKGDKAQLLKRCSMRAKCFVETDAGFSPTPSKTDLAHHDPFTVALKNFGGDKPHGKESGATVEIFKDGKQGNILQLEREYQEWTLQMHDLYDEEMDSGEDEPVLVVCVPNKRRLGISADVIRVHQAIRRKGSSWRSGMKVKVLKGAVGSLKSNLYATLEYIVLEGFQGDMGGEARLICRPLSCSDEGGSLLSVSDGTATLEICDSIVLPISVIDSGKCQVVDTETWNYQLGRKQGKTPSRIDILSGNQCRLLDIIGELPVDAPIFAGCVPPSDIVAVIRPANFGSSSSFITLDQKYIFKDELEMSLQVIVSDDENGHHDGEICFTERVKSSTYKGFHGLYMFPLGRRYPKIFCRAGVYTFHFSIICGDGRPIFRVVKVIVRPSSEVGKWIFSADKVGRVTDESPLTVRVGSSISCLSVASYDIYSNQQSFSSLPEIILKIRTESSTLVNVGKLKMALSSDRKFVEIMDIHVESSNLDMIRPRYESLLEISLKNDPFSQSAPCTGPLHSIIFISSSRKPLTPGDVIEELLFEAWDAYGNHVEEGIEVNVELKGLCFVNNGGPILKVDSQGCIDLSHLLKVMAGYGATVHLAIYYGSKMLLEKQFQVDYRELRVVSGVPRSCAAGSCLENIVFEIFGPNGVVDEAIHGQYHTLVIESGSMKLNDTVQYRFQHGRCTVPLIRVPREVGIFCFSASHTHHHELCTSIEVYVVESPILELVNAEEPGVNNFHSQLLDYGTLLPDSSHHGPIPMDVLVDNIIDVARKLGEDIAKAAEEVGNREGKLNGLMDQKASIAQDLDDLQAELEPCLSYQVGCLSGTKEQVVKCIEAKEGTAAAVICSLPRYVRYQEPQEPEGNFVEDVVGVVAILGTVADDRLSRIFAEYLTENYMLAVVFKSYQAAASLQKYALDGKGNHDCALHKIASKLGRMINKQFTAIFLDELRRYSGKCEESGHEGKLVLPRPRLPSGEVPQGFIGYAVNMINVDIQHLHTKTSLGYGLRETLFYCLFGKLQVYQTREDIEHAKAFINCGAVSLDGGIMRNNGIISLGDCDPDVKFPVLKAQQLSERSIKVLKQIEDKKSEMSRIEDDIAKETAALSKATEKFRKRGERLTKVMQGKKFGYKPL